MSCRGQRDQSCQRCNVACYVQTSLSPLVHTFAYEFNLSRLIRQGFRELRQRRLGEPVRNDRNTW